MSIATREDLQTAALDPLPGMPTLEPGQASPPVVGVRQSPALAEIGECALVPLRLTISPRAGGELEDIVLGGVATVGYTDPLDSQALELGTVEIETCGQPSYVCDAHLEAEVMGQWVEAGSRTLESLADLDSLSDRVTLFEGCNASLWELFRGACAAIEACKP